VIWREALSPAAHSSPDSSNCQIGVVTVARLLAGEDSAGLQLADLPEPWTSLAATIADTAIPDRARAFAAAVTELGGDANYIQAAVSEAAADLNRPPAAKQRKRRLGERLSAEQAEAAEHIGLQSPDSGFTAKVLDALLCLEMERRPPVLIRRRNAGRVLLQWLAEHGAFLRAEDEELWYLFRDEARPMQLDSDLWAAWLYALSGTNPASTDFAWLQADCKAAATACYSQTRHGGCPMSPLWVSPARCNG